MTVAIHLSFPSIFAWPCGASPGPSKLKQEETAGLDCVTTWTFFFFPGRNIRFFTRLMKEWEDYLKSLIQRVLWNRPVMGFGQKIYIYLWVLWRCWLDGSTKWGPSQKMDHLYKESGPFFVLTNHHSISIPFMSASDYRRMKVKWKQTYFHLGCVCSVTCLLGLCCVLMGMCHRVSL